MIEKRNHFAPALDEGRVAAMGSLALAHVGDAVFELLVRLHHCEQGRETSAGLHGAAISMVNASAQARDAARLLPALTPEEADVYRRGRNAKVHSVPRHTDVGDYHAATGLEALLGYLYLLGRTERVSELFGMILEEDDAT